MNQTLPKERLATTDQSGKRVYLYPADVWGKYRLRRQWVHAFLIVLFLALPWLRWSGHQLFLLDVARREFFLFDLHFRATDAPLLLFVFLAALFLFGFVTAVWGRVWCGWACPQTVFTDFLFRRVERWIEGPPRARRELDDAPPSAAKILKRSAKWAVYLGIALLFTHSFLAYFVGSRELVSMLTGSPTENWESFLVVLFTSAIVLFDFGWFREQFCIIACPYGRLQSVMLDSNSMVVGYDTKRGEPRRGTVPGQQGDCVDCLRCVQVCPTGIDIRRGLQMECISCTACIDACDTVMEKIKKPTGLIRYTSQRELSHGQKRRFGARAYAYAALFLAVVTGLVVSLAKKDFLEVAVLRAAGMPYEMTEVAGKKLVLNHFRLELSNQTGKPASLSVALPEELKRAGAELVIPMNPFPVPVDANQRLDFFVRFPASALENGTRKTLLRFHAEAMDRELEVNLVGPGA